MRILRIVAVILVAIAGSAFGPTTFFHVYRPLPMLAAGISSLGDERAACSELTKRLNEKFPIGSSDAILKAELEREGWGPVYANDLNKLRPHTQYARFKRHISLLFVEVATVSWRSDDNGNLIEIRGGYFRDAFFKQG